MIQKPPVLPSYETPVLEPIFNLDTNLDPQTAAIAQALLQARFGVSWFQFLNLLLKCVLSLLQVTVTGDAIAGAVTLDGLSGIVTTEPLTTALNALYALTITNNQIDTSSNILAVVYDGSNSGGTAVIRNISVENGFVVLQILNRGLAAFNGSLRVNFLVK